MSLSQMISPTKFVIKPQQNSGGATNLNQTMKTDASNKHHWSFDVMPVLNSSHTQAQK